MGNYYIIANIKGVLADFSMGRFIGRHVIGNNHKKD